jgi:hypothetical protein
MLALSPATAIEFPMTVYMLEEILGVLVLLAAAMATFFVLAVAIVVFREGIRRAVLWAKTGVMHPARLNPKRS